MDPGPLRPVGRLKGADFVVALQCQRDFIETFQQACAPARIDCKFVPLSRRRDDRLLLQVDADTPGPLGLLHLRSKAIDSRFVEDNRQDAVLEAIAKKMSPKLEPMTARMPISCNDQTAPSREEPQPKFGPVMRISALR